MNVFITIILDGVGIGAQPDAGRYGDAGSLGLGCIDALEGVPCVEAPAASYGRMREVSAGKDSTTGHWELAGLRLTRPFPTYPDGFPETVIRAFLDATGCEGVLGNKPASGTAIAARVACPSKPSPSSQ